jgi:hypothetical protein
LIESFALDKNQKKKKKKKKKNKKQNSRQQTDSNSNLKTPISYTKLELAYYGKSVS